MKIEYQETSSDLMTRINIHDAFGARDIDKWMLKVLPLEQNMAILDIGCGAGKQSVCLHWQYKGDRNRAFRRRFSQLV